jgi:hypothetical protein
MAAAAVVSVASSKETPSLEKLKESRDAAAQEARVAMAGFLSAEQRSERAKGQYAEAHRKYRDALRAALAEAEEEVEL